MTYMINLLLDLRDFAYIHYSSRYGKVSAKQKTGYPLLFSCLFLSYYIIILTLITKVIRFDELYYTLKSGNPLLYYLVISAVILGPLISSCFWVLNKLEKIQPLYYKSASLNYSRKQWRGWTTLVLGWIIFFLYFWTISNLGGIADSGQK